MIFTTSDWQRPRFHEADEIAGRVGALLRDIRQNGDSAINRCSHQFDGFTPALITLKPFEECALSGELRRAIKMAAQRIKRFAEFQMESLQTRSFSDEFGEYSQIVSPIERIAAYIPGGKAPLISTALMTLIPATVAGCPVRIAMSPSTNEALLAAASLAGATQFVRIGGAQAIAAAAFGYGEIAPCDMVVGPGNAYVAEAKAQLQQHVKIDTVAGPSEVLIVADEQTPMAWILEDALAQSEHGEDASAVIVSCSSTYLSQLLQMIHSSSSATALLQRQQIQLVLAKNDSDLIAFCNRYAAEHLQWCAAGTAPVGLKHFGAQFVGAQSPVALGDYISGPNHTLPTRASARRSGGLSVVDFVRLQTRQQMQTPDDLYQLAAVLADAEGLTHHANSLRMRQEN